MFWEEIMRANSPLVMDEILQLYITSKKISSKEVKILAQNGNNGG